MAARALRKKQGALASARTTRPTPNRLGRLADYGVRDGGNPDTIKKTEGSAVAGHAPRKRLHALARARAAGADRIAADPALPAVPQGLLSVRPRHTGRVCLAHLVNNIDVYIYLVNACKRKLNQVIHSICIAD